ncbi:hypothetical protein COW36_05015 [bacterium (Candidatus Blackallbacteria) CG17_big_fil_post_rev_8_21_14_2_50_48_46]|uniref:Uncharacterized protein n=1 Tax=bacterium (Candidatus Blackallbacteria) CG17_big_fil_post_rev_8_21_14_2_50_48_46 TaxID=2014261 RepID=A0A2M7G989_9BACT|nr:MAG: hypothetical protein COW64_03930 [bacterium (Candidatus Blackallbacteria) CG18_big_fil_WC_8_21_14_2_50_49_26]PIW18657.1 MAG: hypothetical protein COW36_05015 [bacterium (Candidatus Blackallbacteria) CG17_big_fil_post_rev_8_21_14_2_50_48_46]PIW46357.1 MAG: hypothetical protein COW20_15665 [bacterium (Candidatus Blackallbacteria) CG13_big_fil_rev_8_21_14_2_50_49_14]
MNAQARPWYQLNLSPDKLTNARLELHWASQIVAAVGATYLPFHPDMSHTGLGIDPQGHILGQEVKPSKTFRLALDIRNLKLELQGHGLKGFETVNSFNLANHKLDAGFDWVDQALQDYVGSSLSRKVMRKAEMPWQLPAHPLGGGAIFAAPNPSFEELYHWFANAEGILQEIFSLHPMNATRLTLWPKHFDMFFSFIRPVYSVAIGFSAGDAVMKEPYFYIKPSPLLPEPLPTLTYGEWKKGNWNGAVLTAGEILAAGNGQAQRDLTWKFLYSTLGVLNWLV